MIHTSLDAHGVLLATIAMPGRSMNVFSAALMDALDALMSRVETDPAVRCVLLTSGKASFLAGADLAMVRGFTEQAKTLDHTALFALCGRLGQQFVRLELCAKPWVAGVNGTALGGGLELAMACRARVVADNPNIQLGLPEVRWGLLPGAGGTQRLPRMVGLDAGLELLLSGRSMSPDEAVARHVFSAAVPAAQLLEVAHALALSLCERPYDPAEKFHHLDQATLPAHSAQQARSLAIAHGVSEADYLDYPAYGVIVDCVLKGARQPLAQASATEMEQFLRLMQDPVAGHMVGTLFLKRQAAERALAAPEGLQVTHISHGELPPGLAAWAQLLAKSRVPLQASERLATGQMELLLSDGQAHRVRLLTLSAAPEAPGPEARALLSELGPYGCVIEIQSPQTRTADALAALAARLGALPFRVPTADGVLSTLQAVSGQGQARLDAQSLQALALCNSGAIDTLAWVDVAACVAGVTPAYCGGPFANLWARRETLVRRFNATQRHTWARIEGQLREACA